MLKEGGIRVLVDILSAFVRRFSSLRRTLVLPSLVHVEAFFVEFGTSLQLSYGNNLIKYARHCIN